MHDALGSHYNSGYDSMCMKIANSITYCSLVTSTHSVGEDHQHSATIDVPASIKLYVSNFQIPLCDEIRLFFVTCVS